jgi:molybdopterin-dependent oxidoreductase alpha subunit
MGIFSSRPKRAVRPPKAGWAPEHWATRVPLRHPENFAEVFRAAFENRDNLAYAWRILRDGVCDGCALGTSGLSDWTVEGVHLCNVRLRLLRLNTMPALDVRLLTDVAPLRELRARELRALGRLPYPLLRRKGEAGFKRIAWDEALALVAERFRATAPARSYLYLTSRGIPNETYYAVQKAVRAMGSNNLDNAARICHSPSTFALKAALGVAATTCSYSDLIGTDLVSFIGSNVANNQPVMMKYLYHAKKAGTKVVTIGPYCEPGMDAYWVPSDLESALFGTRVSDRFFQVKPGGDRAFVYGVLKVMLEQRWLDARFIEAHTAGFDELRAALEGMDFGVLERLSGLPRNEMAAYAELLAQAEKVVFVWGMGVTQHTDAEATVHAILDLALGKGFVGREGCGVMPIRGHSGVQGGAEMGAYATALPGGLPVTAENAAALSSHYGFAVPSEPGLTLPEALDAAKAGNLDVLFAVGGNFREVMPDPAGVDEALERIPLRIHMDIALSTQMFAESGEAVLLLPAMTRYEVPGGVTETSTERRVIYSPEIPGPRIGEARPEWEVFGELAARVRPELAEKVRFAGTQAIREEIARVVPWYEGIQHLRAKGDQFQYGGERLCEGWRFATPDGKARFHVAPLPEAAADEGAFTVVTRRGKQFNSIVHEDVDPLTRHPRDAVLMHHDDLVRLGLAEGAEVVVENAVGRLRGRAFAAPVALGSVHLHWPEANVLVDPHARSPLAQIPAYKEAKATVRPVREGELDAAEVPRP